MKNPDPQLVMAGIGESHKSTYVIAANTFSLVGNGAGFKVAVGVLLVLCNNCWVIYRHRRLLGRGSCCEAGVAICSAVSSV